MSTATERIAALEEMLNAQERKMAGKVRTVIIVYAVLILLVAAYTSFVVAAVRELTSRQAVAEQVGAWLNENLHVKRQELVDQLTGQADDYAKTAVKFVLYDVLPEIENRTRDALDGFGDLLAQEVEEQIFPAFADFIRDDAERLRREYGTLRKDETGAALVTVFIDVIEREMDKYLNDHFIAAVGELQAQIRALAKPKGPLTRKELAQRQALVHWSYLAEHGEVGSSLYYDMLQEAKERFAAYMSGLAGTEDVDAGDRLHGVRSAATAMGSMRAKLAGLVLCYRAGRSGGGARQAEAVEPPPEDSDVEYPERERVDIPAEPDEGE
jgi:hypothetical protein